MKKWIGLLLSLLFTGVLFFGPAFSALFKPGSEGKSVESPQTVFAQSNKEKEEKRDSYSTDLLKQIREKVEGWLKSLNDKIESEEITHFEVRFYEILRSILEWLREKIDAEIGPPENEKFQERGPGRPFRQTRGTDPLSLRSG